jgi:hypothetical protein
VTEEEVLQLIRNELREIFEDANNLSKKGHGGFGTSATDMSKGGGTPIEYLVQAIEERQQKDSSR